MTREQDHALLGGLVLGWQFHTTRKWVSVGQKVALPALNGRHVFEDGEVPLIAQEYDRVVFVPVFFGRYQ